MTSAAPRTTLEAIKIERGLTWRDVARAVERASATAGGRSVSLSEDHARRLGTRALGEVQPTPAIARALEGAFGHPVAVLLGHHDPAATAPAGRPSYQEALTMAAEKARHLALNMPGIDDYSLLEEELRDLARAYPVQALPELINPLVTLQDAVHQAILSPRRPGDAAQLFSIGAVTGGILAKASHDLGDARAAVTQARTALILAEQAGNMTVAAWLNGLMALDRLLGRSIAGVAALRRARLGDKRGEQRHAVAGVVRRTSMGPPRQRGAGNPEYPPGR